MPKNQTEVHLLQFCTLQSAGEDPEVDAERTESQNTCECEEEPQPKPRKKKKLVKKTGNCLLSD